MSKKSNERFYLESFFRFLCEKPSEVFERESPDFIVTFTSGKRVGVEVVEYHSALKTKNGNSRRAFEETMGLLYKNLFEEAKKYPELKGIDGSFELKELRCPPKSKHKDFIEQVRQLTLEKIQEVQHKNYLEIAPDEIRFHLLSQYIKKIRLYKTEVPFHLQWGGVDVSCIGLEENELIDIIQPKINKAETIYRKEMQRERIDQLWLLVVSGPLLSQAMLPPEWVKHKLKSFNQLNNLLKKSGYNRVYLYQYMFDVVHEWPGWKNLKVYG